MTYQVLCAHDGSSGADKAFEVALELAKRFDGVLHVICVFEPAEASRGVKSEALADTARGQFADALEALSRKAALAGLELQRTVSIGSPAQQILKKADELKADHLVLGQRGKNAFERSTVGSVSLRVVTHGTGTVTIVR
jgi:nucleotide-binding universal stress UspA family protein